MTKRKGERATWTWAGPEVRRSTPPPVSVRTGLPESLPAPATPVSVRAGLPEPLLAPGRAPVLTSSIAAEAADGLPGSFRSSSVSVGSSAPVDRPLCCELLSGARLALPLLRSVEGPGHGKQRLLDDGRGERLVALSSEFREPAAPSHACDSPVAAAPRARVLTLGSGTNLKFVIKSTM